MSSRDEADVLETISDGGPAEIITYNSDPDLTCTICNAEFLEPEYLKIHVAHVHVSSNFILRICQFCSEEYSDMMDYAEHIRDHHICSLKLCSYCWRVFENAEAHREHTEKHIINKFLGHYSCSQCRQWFADLNLLKKHEYEDHLNSDGVLLQEVLPYLSAVLKVKSITFIEAISSEVVYICVGCSFSTVDIRTYVRHVKSNVCEVYVCHSCGNVFNKKNYLIRHSKLNCDIYGRHNKKTKLCPDCNTHVPVSSYTRHKTTCKPIKCFTCDIRFENMNEWAEHQSIKHAGTSIEVETCHYCWKRFVGTVALNRHIEKSHKPELHLYKYLCVYCKSIFKHPQKLFGHFFTRHKDILPYTCKICDKTFRFRKKFTIHIKLSHDSVGFVEFDNNYHVFFTNKKSENPFIPKSLYVNEIQDGENLANSTKDDIMKITETEGNQTEVEITKKSKLKRKRVSRVKQDNSRRDKNESSDENEPLVSIRKRIKIHRKIGPYKKKEKNRKILTCNICNKYCYTFQNYNHHVSLHSRHEVKKCIKCPEIFKSKAKLEEHIKKEHSSSKLLETLKNLIEKRKNGGSIIDDLPTSEKFRRTIKKVKTESVPSSAIITTVDQKLSVQKFLENFVPDENKTDIETTASLKVMVGYVKEPTIKLTKFKPSPISDSLKLAMPVKFVDQNPEKVKLTVKIVQAPITKEEDYHSDYYDDPVQRDTYESIPEVAEEVMLEGTDDGRKQIQNDVHKPNQSDVNQKIVIPKLPKDQVRDIQIAHLLPQAPFYKIVKVKDVLNQDEEEMSEEGNTRSSIKLPDGTKLVTANPLAHLLGNKQKKVLNSLKNKYYKPKNSNFPDMLAQALQTLDKPSCRKKKRISIKTEEN